LRQRDRLGRDVTRDGGVDPASGDIGAIAAGLLRNRAKARMIAERLAGIGAEAAAARTFCHFLGNQRHGAVQAAIEDMVAGLKAGIGLLVLDERPEAAQPSRDRLAGLRMLADLARQREQLERKVEVDIAGRSVLRNARAPWFLVLGIILLLAELDIG